MTTSPKSRANLRVGENVGNLALTTPISATVQADLRFDESIAWSYPQSVPYVVDYLDLYFSLAMPNLTHHQIRSNYPEAFIRTFHHAMIIMLPLFCGHSIINRLAPNSLLAVHRPACPSLIGVRKHTCPLLPILTLSKPYCPSRLRSDIARSEYRVNNYTIDTEKRHFYQREWHFYVISLRLSHFNTNILNSIATRRP
jgi:hypothetical protein